MGGKASDLTARGQSGGSGTAQRLGGVTPGLGDDWITHMRGRPRQRAHKPAAAAGTRPCQRDHGRERNGAGNGGERRGMVARSRGAAAAVGGGGAGCGGYGGVGLKAALAMCAAVGVAVGAATATAVETGGNVREMFFEHVPNLEHKVFAK